MSNNIDTHSRYSSGFSSGLEMYKQVTSASELTYELVLYFLEAEKSRLQIEGLGL